MSLLEKLTQPVGKPSKAKKSIKQKPDVPTGGFPRVDLMPQSHREAKEKDAAKAKWIKVVSLVVVAVIVMVGLSFAWAFWNGQVYEQTAELERQSQEQLSEYSEISSMLADINRLDSVADDATSTSVDWDLLIGEINDGLPDTSVMETFSVISGDPDGGETPVVVRATIVSSEPLDYADVIYSIPGTTNTQLGNLTASPGGDDVREYTYNVSFGFNAEVLENFEEEDSAEGTTETDVNSDEEGGQG